MTCNKLNHKIMEINSCQAQAEVWNLALSFLKSMSFKCALDLGIPDAISNNGEAMSLEQLLCAISLPLSKKFHLRRLMRLLTHCGLFIEKNVVADSEPVYDLTPQSRLLVSQEDKSSNLLSLVSSMLHDICVKPSLIMGDWFKQEEKKIPFMMEHGCTVWDFMGKDPIVNNMFNDAMVSGTCLFHDVIVRHGGDIFSGIESLVDVGGGKGAMAELITKNFSHVRCSVLDLPHVVADCPNDGLVKFVSGDMFSDIPPADIVLLKWILHDWSDEDCIKILRRCKDAIPSKETGGKVLVLEAVVGLTSGTISDESQLLLDILMLIGTDGGVERDENQWKKLFTQAGFTSYKIIHTHGFMSIIEIYP